MTEPSQPSQPRTAGQNGLGIAGFVTSLVGIVTCGIIAPIGLLLSLIALFKRPRGFAVAGTVIGAVMSIFLVVAGIGIVAGFLGLANSAKQFSAVGNLTNAKTTVQNYMQSRGQLPSEGEAKNLITTDDPWGKRIRYERIASDEYTLRSAGPDSQFNTSDDVVGTYSADGSRTSIDIGGSWTFDPGTSTQATPPSSP
jgi:hypothetical protein